MTQWRLNTKTNSVNQNKSFLRTSAFCRADKCGWELNESGDEGCFYSGRRHFSMFAGQWERFHYRLKETLPSLLCTQHISNGMNTTLDKGNVIYLSLNREAIITSKK